MPPSPRLSATLDAAAYTRACEELGIPEPHFAIYRTRGPNGRYGDFNGLTYTVRMFLGGISEYSHGRLIFAQTELSRTILHELRHGHQWWHDRPTFDNTLAAERDAEGWAVKRVSDYKTIIRLSRTFPNSGFSRLTRHAVQRSV